MRALVVGMDGTLGAGVTRSLVDDGHLVFGTTRRPHSPGPGIPLPLDLGADDAAQTALPPVDVAVFCAAMARFADCRNHPATSRRVNVETPVALAERLIHRGSRVVLLSTSAVFDGSAPQVEPNAPRRPSNAYGVQKKEAEDGFLTLGPAASVLRLTKVLTPDMALLRGWIESLSTGASIQAFTDLTLCPLAPAHVTAALRAVIADAGGGIYQVSGADDLSYHGLATLLAARLGAAATQVDARRAVEHGIPANEILPFTSLDASRLTALTGTPPPGADEVLNTVFFSPPANLAASAVR